MAALVTGLLGLLLGMRHALEPDHLAAVSTLASEQRGPRASLALGALWGLGHSVTLLAVSGGLALFESQLPNRVAVGFELAVAFMVVGLGVRAVFRAWREAQVGPLTTHAHGALRHTHPAPSEHVHVSRWTFATRPLLVGVMHGLAGSGAMTALVLPGLPTFGARLTYLLLFGLGSVVGMALLTGLVGVPLTRLTRAPRAAAAVLGFAGLISIGVGLWWGVESATQLL